MTKIKLTAEDYDGLLRAYETTVECLCGDDVLSAEIDKAVFSNDLDLKRRVLERLKVLLGEDVLSEDEEDSDF